MNYAQARQHKDGSEIWTWSTRRDNEIRMSAPCTDDCRHATTEEACRHFYDFCLESAQINRLTVEPGGVAKWACTLCGEETDIQFGNHRMGLAMRPVALCEKHANMESLARVYPFSGSMEIIHS